MIVVKSLRSDQRLVVVWQTASISNNFLLLGTDGQAPIVSIPFEPGNPQCSLSHYLTWTGTPFR
jgi:hypothetical protein